MFKFIAIIIFLLLGYCSIAQQYLNKTFLVDGSYNTPVTIFPTDSGYLCSGTYGVVIFMLDSSANLKWKKQYNIGPAYMNNLYKSQNGEYITTSTVQYGGIIEKLYLIKFNYLFDTLLTRIYITDSSTVTSPMFYYSFENINGNYVVLGNNSKDSLGNAFPNDYTNGMLLRLDTNGNILNKKLIGPLIRSDWFRTGLQIENKYYLLGGTVSYSTGLSDYDKREGWVVKTDLQGNELASQHYGNPNLADDSFNFCSVLNDSLIVTGGRKGLYKDINDQLHSANWLVVINKQLELKKEVTFLENRNFIDVKIRNSNELFALCNKYNEDRQISLPPYTLTSQTYAELYSLTSNLKVKWIRKLAHVPIDTAFVEPGLNKTSIGNVLTCTGDNGFLIGGYVGDNNLTPTQQAWLVKTDSLGCDGFHSCDDTTLVCQILQAPDTACKNDTAWLQVKFKGRSAPYFVYANNTLALDSVYYPYTLPLWIDTLIPYFPIDTGMQQVIIKVNDPWGWHNNDTVQIFVKNCGSGNIEEAWYPKKVEIYPNPASTELHVKIRTTITTPVAITIYNMQGKTVKQITTKQNETVIDLKGLEEGVYGIRVTGNNIIHSDRFIKL